MIPMNPLATAAVPQQRQPDPAMMRHAMMWQHMQQQDTDALHQQVSMLDYAAPVLGALAANPKTTPKQVIKAVSDAVAAQKIDPEQGVSFVSQMPADKDALGPWLREHYVQALTGAVHAKAALMRQGPAMMPQAPNPLMGSAR